MPRKEMRESRLKGLLPVKDNAVLQRLASAKRVQAKRTPLYNLNNAQRETVLFPLKFLKEMGVEVPEMNDKAIFVTTGPNNGQLESKEGTFSFVLSGSSILYSINGGPRKKMTKRGLQA